MKKILKFIIGAVVVYALFSANLALAVTCEVLHVNFTGQCVLATDNCPSDKQAIDNSRTDLCLPGQKCCYKTVADSATDLKPVSDDNIQLQIPLFDFSEATSLVQYIAKIYEYILIILVPLTIIMIIWGGIQWVIAAGDAGKITAAKKQIIQAFVGLFIGLFSYVILSLVGITQLNMPGLQKIDPEAGDILVMIPEDYKFGLPTNIKPGELFCPKSGGAQSIPQITSSSSGKVTYRLGGKMGKNPPYADSGPYASFKSYCPENTLCLDCSGYAAYVLECAGIQNYGWKNGQSTLEIFGCDCNKSEKISSYTDTTVNNKPLKAGDLVGMPSGCPNIGVSMGHVVVYDGNGKFFDCHGGKAGRQPGACIGQFTLSWFATQDPSHKSATYRCIKRAP